MSKKQKATAASNGNEHLIELRQVVKTYKSAAGNYTALKNVDLQVDKGEFVAVIGKSGSGKSTLINMITGIDRPSSGEVMIGDKAVHKLREGKMAEWRGRNVGVIFQFFQLLPTLTVVENVMLPMDFCNMYSRRERKRRAMDLLAQVDLTEHARKLPSRLSGGQQQRVAIARALANDPPILVADEPTGNLDSKTAEAMFRLFERLVEGGKTILMVTHDNDLAERVTRTLIISDGEIIEEYLAEAFPALTEEQLIWATRNLELQQFAPGEVIIEQGAPHEDFYLVTRGHVEVRLNTANGQEFLVDRLGIGQYFGEIALLRGVASTATVRAAPDAPVRVAALDRETFTNLIGQSELTGAAMDEIMRARLDALARKEGNDA
ncbi:MAG: ATP-binding cassette domain-containing protein [Anaerolineae bacterium]|nr:ATP-binding cassette domain-containing protein [Anaerolineae bacterium]